MHVTGFLLHGIQSQKSVLFSKSKTKMRNCCTCSLLRCSKWIHLDWIPKTSYTQSEAAHRAQTVKVYGLWATFFFSLNVVERPWCHNDVVNIHPAETFSCECIYHEITGSYRSASSYVNINLHMNRQVTASSHFFKSHQSLDVNLLPGEAGRELLYE